MPPSILRRLSPGCTTLRRASCLLLPGCIRSRRITPGKLLLPLLLLLSPPPLAAQAWDTQQVLDSLRARFNRVEDYQVDLQVSLVMPMLRMPRKKMTFSFKQPDKTRLGARGFAMVPRRGLAFAPDTLFENLHDLTMVGDTLMNGHPCLILRGFEKGPDDLILSADVIVDRELWLVRGVTTFMEDNEVFRLRTEYVEVAPGIHMPGETRLRFQLNERSFRGRHSWDPSDPDVPKPVLDDGQEKVGEASISFTNYRVNQGIPDEFFHDK